MPYIVPVSIEEAAPKVIEATPGVLMTRYSDENGERAGSFATTPAVRRRMQAQPVRDTSPEVALRRELHSRGLRYRVHARPIAELRRQADIVFRPSKVAVFVDGCFWHACPDHNRSPRVNQWYWSPKLVRNVERDRETDQILARAGWLVIRVWEHCEMTVEAGAIEEAVRCRAPYPREPANTGPGDEASHHP